MQGRLAGQDQGQGAAKWRPKIEEELARLTVLGERVSGTGNAPRSPSGRRVWPIQSL